MLYCEILTYGSCEPAQRGQHAFVLQIYCLASRLLGADAAFGGMALSRAARGRMVIGAQVCQYVAVR